MITQKQVIIVECDLCEEKIIKEEEIPLQGLPLIISIPEDWWEVGGGMIACPKHQKIIITVKEGILTIEDNTLGRFPSES